MSFVSFEDLKGRWNHLCEWVTYKLNRKIDTIMLNKSTYTTTNGVVDLGEIYGDEVIYSGDGSGSESTGWNGWIRLFRFRLRKGRGGSSSPIGSFNALGDFYAPNGLEIGQLLVLCSGNRKDSPSEPWRGQGGSQNFAMKMLTRTDNAITSDDLILAIDKTNSNMSTSDGVINVELWARHPARKNSFKWYYSNASVMGSNVTVDKQTYDSANVLNRKIFSLAGITKLITCTSTYVGNASSASQSKFNIDSSTTDDMTLAASKTNVDNYTLYQADEVTPLAGIPQAVAIYKGATPQITIDKLKDFADTTEDGTPIWTDHTPSVNQPYFAEAQFNNVAYYLIKCDEPAQK